MLHVHLKSSPKEVQNHNNLSGPESKPIRSRVYRVIVVTDDIVTLTPMSSENNRSSTMTRCACDGIKEAQNLLKRRNSHLLVKYLLLDEFTPGLRLALWSLAVVETD